MPILRSTAILALLLITACGSDSAETSDTTSGTTTTTTTTTSSAPLDMDPPGPAGCKRSVIEADSMSFGPLAGAGVDPATGKLNPLPAGAIISTTYLALKGDDVSKGRFGELVAPITQSFATQSGLLAVQLATSASCGTARTLSVWKDEASMLTFVAGPAHSAAVSATGEVSRGGSVVTSWDAVSAEEATWETAAKKLGETFGPYY